MSSLIQRNFSSGEISPNLYSRVDLSKYANGLRTMRNFLTMRMGGATNRAGSKFIGYTKELDYLSYNSRLIEFVFNTLQTYVLEFGDKTIRFIKNDSFIFDSTKTITGVTNASPAVVTSNAHGFSNGDQIYISGVLGMTELNNRYFIVGGVTANTFELKEVRSSLVNIDSTSYGTYTSAGTAARIYTIATPYSHEDLSELKYIQSADVMTITHQSYPPAELSRLGDASWTINSITFGSSIRPPTSVTNNGGAGSTTEWVVTSIARDTFEESVVSANTQSSTVPSSGTPVTISWTDASGTIEYNVYKKTNNLYGFIGISGGSSFIDNGIVADTSITPPVLRNPFGTEATVAINGITKANPAVVTTGSSHGYATDDYVFIKDVVGMTEVNGKYFKVGVLTATTFNLYAFGATTPLDSSGYGSAGTGGTSGRSNDYFPKTCAYFQQRLGFANTPHDPENIWLSQIGIFHNFDVSTPVQDDDAVSFQLVGRQVNGVHHLLDLGRLASFTQVGEWIMEGDQSGAILPGSVNPKQRSYNGSNATLAPVVVDSTAIYVQARGSAVRDFNFDFQVDGYRGNEISIFSEHLLDGYSLLDISYQKVPHSNLWFVRDDGVLLGLTYVPSQNILGWHRHDFENGIVENICTIPYGNEDVLYLTIQREIDGHRVRCIERINSRFFDDVKDAIFLDSSVTYDGRNSNEALGMTLSGGSTWAYTETLTLTATAATFTTSFVGNQIQLVGSDGELIRFTIDAYSSSTVVTGRAHRTVPTSLRGVETSNWTYAKSEISGLWHLEGEDVSVFGDGFVVANPNNEAYVIVTVENGQITLDKPYGVVHVGLPITADVETLNIDSNQSQTISDKRMTVNRVSLHVKDTRGLWVGSQPPTDDSTDNLDGLTELKLRNDETMDDPVSLKTDVVDVVIESQWNNNGRIFIRQVDPVPATITAIVPDGIFPFKNVGT